MKPLFSETGLGSRKITLVKDDNIVSDDQEVAETFNHFFKNSVESLDIKENLSLQNDTRDLVDPVEIASKKFETHPSVVEIRRNIT